jgi:hypothetical protein
LHQAAFSCVLHVAEVKLCLLLLLLLLLQICGQRYYPAA